MKKVFVIKIGIMLIFLLFLSYCTKKPAGIQTISDLNNLTIGVPQGTVANILLLEVVPDANLLYFESTLAASEALQEGRIDAVVYDLPILQNIIAMGGEFRILEELISHDNYAFAVNRDNHELKHSIDDTIEILNQVNYFDEMRSRWIPEIGYPVGFEDYGFTAINGVLRFGTAPITKPFSYYDENGKIAGFDIELATIIAHSIGMDLEIVEMNFGQLIPAVISGQVDMIGAFLTITEARAESILFSIPYYKAGLGVMVK